MWGFLPARSGLGRLKPLLLAVMVWALLYAGKPVEGRSSHSARLNEVLKVLGESPQGAELLKSARAHWGLAADVELLHFLRWGSVSKTDAVLTRHFDPASGAERRERRVTIYLRLEQSLRETVLDLAHELVHATAGPTWDPYDPDLTAGKYVQTALEGPGGEVKAVAVECRVATELREKRSYPLERCEKYVDAKGGVSLLRIKQDFYKVGRWHRELSRQFGKEISIFPLLSDEAPTLFSSTGRSPYPVALYREYEEINRIACENSRKRLGSFEHEFREAKSAASVSRSMQLTESRSPASQSPTLKFLARRCSEGSRE